MGKFFQNDVLVSVSGSPKAISGPTNTVRIFKLDSEGDVIIDE
jgi:hypothetical protein